MADVDQIQQTADLLAIVTTNAMITAVPVDDFPLWLDVLKAEAFNARIDETGQVRAYCAARHHECFIQVHTVADVFHGVEMAPYEKDGLSASFAPSTAERLESFAPCSYGHAHTRSWCGNPRCREA